MASTAVARPEPLCMPMCNRCHRPVDSWGYEFIYDTVDVPFEYRVKHVFTGFIDIEVKCHGEAWKTRIYRPNGLDAAKLLV